MKLKRSFLSSKVSKRIFILFIVSAIIPIAITGIFSYNYVSSILNSQKQEYLAAASKSYGMSIYDRLLVAEEQFNTLVDNLLRENYDELYDSSKTRVLLGSTMPLFSDTEIFQKPTNFSHNDLTHLQDGNSKISISKSSHNFEIYFTKLFTNSNGLTRLISAKVDSVFIFGDLEIFSGDEDACIVVKNKGVLHCSDTELSSTENLHTGLNFIDDEKYLIATWELFLKGRFNTDSWNIYYAKPRKILLAPLSAFGSIFIPSLVLAILLVSLVSINQISRILIPLEMLSAKTKRILKGDFNTKVKLSSNDEFQALGDSFNLMSTELGNQFSDMQAMAELDRAILSTMDHKTAFLPIYKHLNNSFDCQFSGIIIIDPQHDDMGYLYAYDQTSEKINVKGSIQITEDDEALLFQDTGTFFTLLEREKLNDISWIKLINTKLVSFVKLNEKDKLIGSIVCGFDEFPNLHKNDLLRLEKFVDRVSVALSATKREEKLSYQANYDSLTGLPNRQHLVERFNQAIKNAAYKNNKVAFLFIDLDRFKVINDSQGHATGDKLLIAAADRIRSIVDSVDTVARYGGDEFAAVISNVTDTNNIAEIAKRIINSLSEVFYIDNYEQIIGASIGISMYPNDGDNWDELLQKADIAMYKAKQKNRGIHLFFTDKMQEDIREKAEIEADLYHALDRNELSLMYQPQIEIKSGKVTGAETLIRWNHSKKGTIRPDKFITYAEDNGLIFPIGNWVIRETLRQCEKWQYEHNTLSKIAVNISPKQLRHENFMTEVEDLISDFDIGLTSLEFEITESLFVNDDPHTLTILHKLNDLGISIAIDDFGKGYSSLSYLKMLPVQTLKIDRLFIKDLNRNDNSMAIVKAIIAMGHALNKVVIAEGIETIEQLEILKELKCDRAQGFYISRPKLANDFYEHSNTEIIHLEKIRAKIKSVS